MSDVPSSAQFIQQVSDAESQAVFKLGIVSDLFTNGTAKIQFDGEETASEKQYAYLDGYMPTVGDRVLLAVTSSSHVILGKISYNTTPSSGSTGNFTTLSVTGTTSLSGNLGFFGSTARTQTSISDMSSLQTTESPDSTYSSNEVNMLNHMKQDMTNTYNKLKDILNALQDLGLV
ncbi:hypothetical protein LY28_01353 [Ruminiclostridium sufflavum DSM 19573]|uniref:Uncharacterized protein n=1 Tax=Ruminiclostridium sufflavum DSM 19573 TaxID=1121337 RepID=A0A318Y8F4_9FIRM|nr:hypothetical protein [Ruminiclostridium sufflavum]PYG88504.1 hypothetical protein LY28_01353 [Ruminiclostridium sufflavum DSM 19573]